jgi:hypothetical protein
MTLAAAALAASATSSYAFTSFKIITTTASATTAGTNQADFTLNTANVGTPTVLLGTTTLSWASFDPLTTTWKIAQQVFVLTSTVTDVGGGIKIYTDNTDPTANLRFVAPTAVSTAPTSVAAGLLKAGLPTTSAAPLPMAWSIKTSTRIVEGGTVDTGVGAADPVTGPTTAVFNNKFQWLFITDKSNWANGTDFNGDGDTNDPGDAAPLALDAPFVTMINSVGVHFGQDDLEFGAFGDGLKTYVYMEANFATANVLQAYRTVRLKFEAYLQ